MSTINVRISERDYIKLKAKGKPGELAAQYIRRALGPETVTWVATVRQSKPSCTLYNSYVKRELEWSSVPTTRD